MRTTYLSHRQDLRDRFPSLRPLGDAELAAALHPLYYLLEAEDGDGFYLIFDYRPTLPTAADELAALPPEVLDRAFAVLEFGDAAEREREVEAIRRSLRGGEDDGAGVGARLRPVPPVLSASGARAVIEGEADESGH